jgi:hypothetical protein
MLKKIFTKSTPPALPENGSKPVLKNPVRCITCGLTIEKEAALEKNGKYFCPPKKIAGK